MQKLVSIDEFLTNEHYLGKTWKNRDGKCVLSTYWKMILKEHFKLDSSKNDLATHYNNILLSGARGAGKSKIMNEAIAPYLLYLMLNKFDKNFNLYEVNRAYMEVNQGKLTFCFVNCVRDLGDVAKEKFIKAIESSPWFQDRLGNFQKLYDNIDFIVASSKDDIIGRNIIYCFMDEGRTMKKQKREDLYRYASSTMKIRAKKDKYVFVTVTGQNDYDKNFNDMLLEEQAGVSSWNVRPSIWEGQDKGYPFDSFTPCLLVLGCHESRILPKLIVNSSYQTTSDMIKFLLIPSYFFGEDSSYKENLAYDFDKFMMDYQGIYPYTDSVECLKNKKAVPALTLNLNTREENPEFKLTLDIAKLRETVEDSLTELETLYRLKSYVRKEANATNSSYDVASTEWKIDQLKSDLLEFLDKNIDSDAIIN